MSLIHQCGVQSVTNWTFCPNITEPEGKEVLHETQFELVVELYLIRLVENLTEQACQFFAAYIIELFRNSN